VSATISTDLSIWRVTEKCAEATSSILDSKMMSFYQFNESQFVVSDMTYI
jgi:hypothetical protein